MVFHGAYKPKPDQVINKPSVEVPPSATSSAEATEILSPGSPASAWEDNPYRLRGIGWEGSFADTGWFWIIALATLVSPVAFVIGLLGGLLLHGPRARRKAWGMAAAAIPETAVWALVLVTKG